MSYSVIVERLLNGMANEGRARSENVANSPQPTNKRTGLIKKFLYIRRAGITTGGQLGDIGPLAGTWLSGDAAAFNTQFLSSSGIAAGSRIHLMKKLCIYNLSTLLLCGCVATPEYSDISPSIPLSNETVHNQSTDSILETSKHQSKQTEVSSPSISEEKIEKPVQKSLWPSETGIATYYAPDLEGRTTASGEPYDSEQLTAAHRIIPIGSTVRVTNLKNKQQVIVRINDRLGGGGDRIINLSKQATIKLNFGSAGTIPVQLDVESLPLGSGVAKPRTRIQSLPARLEESSPGNHSRLAICKNEAEILGLAGGFHRNHVRVCLARR